MGDTIIRVENLGKRYVLSHQGGKGDGLRHRIEHFARSPFRWLGAALKQAETANRGNGALHGAGQPKPASKEEFWALKDLNFEIKQGEVVGVIGRNGAGKSTLLKILSRITEPTTGRVAINGRVASLLEVGTGFHPELTGRENVFLNGAILGMSRVEIKKKFDEIVAFAEIEKFLDTPVKRYSSGMYVRLAFAVAAHLEPEILIVDEVLAVGDTQFQQKCLGKMQAVASGEGRTVLFVSHNLAAVRQLCSRGLLLENGRLALNAPTGQLLESFTGLVPTAYEAVFSPDPSRPSITQVRLDPQAAAKGDLEIEFQFESPFALTPPVFGLVISSMSGVPVYASNPRFHGKGYSRHSLRRGTVRFSIQNLPLCGERYQLSVWLGDWHHDFDNRPDALAFAFRGNERSSLRPNSDRVGYLDCEGTWRLEEAQALTV
jgi:lipopolysaccharide transport system ATP-binding protein